MGDDVASLLLHRGSPRATPAHLLLRRAGGRLDQADDDPDSTFELSRVGSRVAPRPRRRGRLLNAHIRSTRGLTPMRTRVLSFSMAGNGRAEELRLSNVV